MSKNIECIHFTIRCIPTHSFETSLHRHFPAEEQGPEKGFSYKGTCKHEPR